MRQELTVAEVRLAAKRGDGLNLLLMGFGPVRRLIHCQWHCTAVIKKINGHTIVSTAVGRIESAVEIGQEIDISVIKSSGSQDTRHHDADVWLGVVSYHGCVDKQSQKRILVGRIIFSQ